MPRRGVAVRRALGDAVVAAVAMAVTAGIADLLAPRADVVVLGGGLALMLSRSSALGSWRGRLEALVALPVLALSVAGIGLLAHAQPWLAAVLFTVALAASVAARRFGPLGRRLGALVAVPFLTALVAPVGTSAPVSAGLPIGLAVPVIALVALVVSIAARLAAQALGIVAAPDERPAKPSTTQPSTLRPSPPIRMAIQMGLALALAWTAGLLLVPGHATWVVLSAYLVLARNRGRADVLHTAGLRLAGAVGGSLLALPLAALPALDGTAAAALVILLLAVGTILRAANYAWWALTVTLVVTVLQQEVGGAGVDLGARVLAIAGGCLLGVLVAWFVLPVRSEGVLRRRLAAVLAAVDEAWRDSSADPQERARALEDLEQVAPPWQTLGRIPLARARRAAAWIAATELIARAEPAVPPRAELGAARRAVREREALLPALERVVAALGD